MSSEATAACSGIVVQRGSQAGLSLGLTNGHGMARQGGWLLTQRPNGRCTHLLYISEVVDARAAEQNVPQELLLTWRSNQDGLLSTRGGCCVWAGLTRVNLSRIGENRRHRVKSNDPRVSVTTKKKARRHRTVLYISKLFPFGLSAFNGPLSIVA